MSQIETLNNLYSAAALLQEAIVTIREGNPINSVIVQRKLKRAAALSSSTIEVGQ